MSGYRLALKESIRYIRENLLVSSDRINDEVLFNVAKVLILPPSHTDHAELQDPRRGDSQVLADGGGRREGGTQDGPVSPLSPSHS